LDVLTFSRAALACYFTFIAVFYTAKLMALRARTGRRHADVGEAGTAQWLGHRLFVVARVAIWALCVARVFDPAVDAWLGPVAFLQRPAAILAGLALLTGSLAGIAYVHSYLGDAWRSGVGPAGPTVLVTSGPYARMRHPLFAAVALGQLGFFLALPSLFTLACLGLGLAVLLLQGRYEERRMDERFGAAWRGYASRTPAIWPGLRGANVPAGA
jgi:protein-S-isoprenylcysteine O-methyltransferase Ste14